uniref:Reverse transcriptase/retrotransposon-derived protein RNase H-like domain-containing protein n=1 Tax=Acrobeloides nanus TaxID=290746 RepID=A0A914E721_9BILA
MKILIFLSLIYFYASAQQNFDDYNFIVDVDVLNHNIRASLIRRYEDQDEEPIAEFLHPLTSTEKKYSRMEKNTLGVYYALTKFNDFIDDELFTLRVYSMGKVLLDYDFVVEYKKGDFYAGDDVIMQQNDG